MFTTFLSIFCLGYLIPTIQGQIYAPLYGNATLGYYFVNVYLGEQLQKESLITDTGSSLTTLPCKGCTDCGTGHYNSLYDITKSSRFTWLRSGDKRGKWGCSSSQKDAKCPFSINYVEGSGYSGNFVEDYVVLYSEIDKFKSSTKQQRESFVGVFGCSTREAGMLRSQEADGLLGLGLSTDSSFPPDLISSAYKGNRAGMELFSLCYGHDGGYMTIGGYNKSKHLEGAPIESFKFDSSHGQYKIIMKSIHVDDMHTGTTKEVLNGGQGVFIDSGTTLIHGPNGVIE